MKIYLAAPLFTLAERIFNEHLAASMVSQMEQVEILLPQEAAAAIGGSRDFCSRMYHWCLQSMDACDALVAVLDGADADSGTCVELGYAMARGKPIVGIRTDIRASEDRGLNLMVAESCSSLIRVPGAETNVPEIAAKVAACLRALLGPHL